MMGHGLAGLLIAVAVGYWVLERASGQKGQLRKVGLFLGSVIIVGSILGALCTALCMSGTCPMGGKMKWGKMRHKGMMNMQELPESDAR